MRLILITCFLALLMTTSCQSNQPTVIRDCNCSEWPNWEDLEGVSCHHITVPEDHSNPGGKQLEIAFAIFQSVSVTDKNVPTLYLTGGPGGRSLASTSRWQSHSLRESGDLIVVEQRGIGLSSPLPDLAERTFQTLAANLTAEEELISMKLLLEMNAQEIKDAGIDVTKYNSTQNAQDFGLLMKALKYSKYNLYGSSYGTRLAAGIMKDYPELIGASILNGPANLDGKALEGRFPNLVNALSKLYAACEADLDCNKKYPDLQTVFLEGLAALERDPITVRISEQDYTINSQDAVYLLRYLLYGSTGFETGPPFIYAIRDRNIQEVEKIAQGPMQFVRAPGITVFYAFQAYEEWTVETPAIVEAAMRESPELQYGLAWFHAFIPFLGSFNPARASAEELNFSNIEVPALVIVNEFDPVTPPHHTKMFTDAIENCQVIRLNEFGHGSDSDCLRKITAAFLKDPSVPIDRSCLDE